MNNNNQTMGKSMDYKAGIFSEEKCNILDQLLHACVDEICGRPGPKFQQFSKIMNWSEEEFDNAYGILLTLLQTLVYMSPGEEMPVEYLALPEQVHQRILACLKVRRNQLEEALLNKYSRNKVPTLLDFDWRLKVVIGSSKMASLREPLLQLDLIIGEKENENLLGLELNKDELDMIISALESTEH